MNNGKIVILCPEIVPMDNKGEEAIIKGVMDILGLKEDNCEYHIIDPSVKTLTIKSGLFLHPTRLFISSWRTKEFGIGLSIDRIYSSLCSILRHLLDKVYPKWISIQPRTVSKLITYIKYFQNDKINKIPSSLIDSISHLAKVDYIIAGHNGGLNSDVCHVLLAFSSSLQIKYTIFGSCMKPKIKEKNNLNLYHEVFKKSENVIARNPIGLKWAEKFFFDTNPTLAPDPAFGLIPITKQDTSLLISKLGLSDFFKKDVLLITCAEPAPISRFSFDRQIGRIAKIKAHREFFGKVLNVLLESYDFNILFLPHTIGPTKDLDDRIIAKDIISHSNHKNSINGRCYVLEEDLNACQLKGIISMGSIMIAERVHSVIGAIGVHTPFLCFASNKDNRVSGMIKEMANLGDNIFYLNTPNIESCIDSFDKIYKNRIFEQQKLIKISNSFQKELDIIGNRIKLQILNSINN